MTSTFDIKSDFDIFNINPNLAYFDSASTTLVPKTAVEATNNFLTSTVSSSRRGAHSLAVRASALVENVRKSLAKLLDTHPTSVSFQKSIPTAIASLAFGLDWKNSMKDTIIIGQSEENSVLVTLQRVAQVLGLKVEIIPINDETELDINHLSSIASKKTGLIAIGDVTVGTGTRNALHEISRISRETESILVTDATRSVGVTEELSQLFEADVALCSANIGLMGPPGLAIQWISKSLGDSHIPGIIGGSAVANVKVDSFDIALQPDKFESGFLNVPAIAGLGAALDYIQSLKPKGYFKHIKTISAHMHDCIYDINGLSIYGTKDQSKSIYGFNVTADDGLNCHEVALFLDESDIAVRSGLVCAHSMIRQVSSQGLVQVSLHAYNSISDIDRLVSSLKTIITELV